MTSQRAQEIRTGLAQLHAADPVLTRLIDDRPGFDPDTWIQKLPSMDLFGALVFQVIGQQISVTAATAIFARLTERFGGRVPNADELAAVDEGTLRSRAVPAQGCHRARSRVALRRRPPVRSRTA